MIIISTKLLTGEQLDDPTSLGEQCVEPDEITKATDCMAFARAPHAPEGFYISSPNALWIPELPWHDTGAMFSYNVDSMLGAFAYTKWLQVWQVEEPHLTAALLHPMITAQIYGKGTSLLAPPIPHFRQPWAESPSYNKWEDNDVVWDNFEDDNWEPELQMQDGELGRV